METKEDVLELVYSHKKPRFRNVKHGEFGCC